MNINAEIKVVECILKVLFNILKFRILPLMKVHIFPFLLLLSITADNIINGIPRPTAYKNSKSPPLSVESNVEDNNRIEASIGPTQGVQEIPSTPPNMKLPK